VVHRIEKCRPTAYRGLILTHGLPWALLAPWCRESGWTGIAVAHVLAYFLLRFVGVDDRMVGLHDPEQEEALAYSTADSISLLPGSVVFFSDKIIWRGLVYRVQNGHLFPVPGASLRK